MGRAVGSAGLVVVVGTGAVVVVVLGVEVGTGEVVVVVKVPSTITV